jgi:periplasmic protein TonB
MSELGNLSDCMVDNDPEVRARARRLRQKALVMSICVEAVCLTAMLLWPLITPGVLPSNYVVTPLPPYLGGGGSTHRTEPTRPHPAAPHRRIPSNPLTYQPPNSQPHLHPAAQEDSAPDISADSGPGVGNGPGSGGDSFLGVGNPNGPRILPLPEPPVRPVRQKVSEGVMAGALVHRVDPAYPTIARNMRLSGVVRLRAIIAADGSVQQLELLSGHPILAQAAKAAVEQWRYRPTLLDGVPVEVETYITVTFILGNQ